MTHLTSLHAEFDRFPALVDSLVQQFGAEGVSAVIERTLEAEAAEFCWDGRLAERQLGAFWDGIEATETNRQMVRVLGYFRASYFVATCVIDAERRVEFLLRYHAAESYEAALQSFLGSP